MTFAKTPFKLKVAMPDILENAEANLTPRMRNLVSLLWIEWKDLEQQIIGMNEEIELIASSDPACQRLRQIPGIGPLVATAIVVAIGNGAAFHEGREFSSWLGLVPRQHSTGGKTRLFGISKLGNRYLRKLLVHGARSAVLRVKRERSRSVHGSMLWRPGRRSTWWSQRQPTSWLASRGPFYQAARIIAQH
jgi:transposase